jgi:hypothetical protein
MSPDVARQALIATHGGLSLEWCATICHISPMDSTIDPHRAGSITLRPGKWASI